MSRPGDAGVEPPPYDEATQVLLKAAFARARGNVVRVRELLADEGLEVPYSTLTRWVRDAELRGPPRRAGEYDFAPGQEMQHDTSPHRVRFGQADKPVTLQCAGLVLAYSRRLFIQYYPRFTRFEARAFLLEAARFMAGVCPVCIIDNTSVLLAAGAGADAVIAPEMAAFARTLGFGFRAHRVGNPDRKGRIERPFAYVETNFLVGRNFADLDDLNGQALGWCRDIANRKPKQALGMSPEAAYVIEQPHHPFRCPTYLPPVYQLLERVVDLHGYVSVDTNRYSVPERYVGKSVTVTKTPAQIEVRHKSTTIATHRRVIDQRAIPARSCPATTPSRCARAAARPPRRRCCAAIMTASTAIPRGTPAARPRGATGGHCVG